MRDNESAILYEFLGCIGGLVETGNRDGEAEALSNLGLIAAVKGERDKACGLLRKAVEVYEEIGEAVNANKMRAALKDVGCS
ncbi:MAG: hypothetical protein IIB57_04120 [Planctomycetes bacterium]|nr:hypothetical protein [Planctomycetota bacterium]